LQQQYAVLVRRLLWQRILWPSDTIEGLKRLFRIFRMETSRRLAILVFCGVPAIIGGGIVYGIFGSFTPMWIYEALLLVTAGALVSR
jgi:zinc transporter ZupT